MTSTGASHDFSGGYVGSEGQSSVDGLVFHVFILSDLGSSRRGDTFATYTHQSTRHQLEYSYNGVLTVVRLSILDYCHYYSDPPLYLQMILVASETPTSSQQ